jgi:hypothetical protein
MNRLILLVLAFTALNISLYAQPKGCATPPGKSKWLTEYQQSPESYPRSSDILYVPLTIHIVGTDGGAGYFSVEKLMDAFCTLQRDFEAADIQFFIEGDIRYINNSTYFNHSFGEGAEMMEIHNIPNTINCYIVADPAGACGYYSPWADGVAIAKSCNGANDHTWAHEIGHFLTLPHTFVGWEGVDYNHAEPTPDTVNEWPVELVDGSNCAEAADGFCDTPADYLSYRWPCNADSLSNQPQKDPTGAEFRSDGTLFMSYAFDACTSRFSQEQINAMRADLLGPRASFLYNQNPPVLIAPATPALSAPINDETIENTNVVELSWEPVPNASGYIVDLDLVLPNGAIFNFEYEETTENAISIMDLASDQSWRWRVRAYNLNDGCTDYSDFATFTTGLFINSTEERSGLSQLELFPVPQTAGQALSLNWTSEQSTPVTMRLINHTGQTIRTMTWETHAGINQRRISTADMAAGMYILMLENKQGSTYKRFVLK